jgi:hypothetical protein
MDSSGRGELARWIIDLADLEVFEKIGQGGYGAVFRGSVKVRWPMCAVGSLLNEPL